MLCARAIVITLFCISVITIVDSKVNNAPIIGVLAQEFDADFTKLYPNGPQNSYIAASYVKYLEGSGARVVPIMIGRNDSYYDELTSALNGVLIPGGDAPFDFDANGYATAFDKIYSHAIAKKLPIWATCLGFEALLIIAANHQNLLVNCSAHDTAYPLKFENKYKTSRLFENAPLDVLNILIQENVTANSHSFCATKQDMDKLGLLKDWDIISINNDENGFEFVSTIESKKYPIWGVQYHPEKNNYEWDHNHYSHTENAIKISQYFSNFFVNVTRSNFNSFKTEKDMESALIYNYQKVHTGPHRNVGFEECYLFE